MFLGEYTTRFTGKGRIVLPKKLRDEIYDPVIIVSRGFEGCILGFSQKDWQDEAKRQLDIPLTEERGRNLRRYFFSASESLDVDMQGRVVIPDHLVKYANLEVEIIVIGAGDHFEIWDKKNWDEHLKSVERSINSNE